MTNYRRRKIKADINKLLSPFVKKQNNSETRMQIEEKISSYFHELFEKGIFRTDVGDPGYKVICDKRNNFLGNKEQMLYVDIFFKSLSGFGYSNWKVGLKRDKQ